MSYWKTFVIGVGNNFIIKLFCCKKCPKFLSVIHKKESKINLAENKLSEIFFSAIFGVNVVKAVAAVVTTIPTLLLLYSIHS